MEGNDAGCSINVTVEPPTTYFKATVKDGVMKIHLSKSNLNSSLPESVKDHLFTIGLSYAANSAIKTELAIKLKVAFKATLLADKSIPHQKFEIDKDDPT